METIAWDEVVEATSAKISDIADILENHGYENRTVVVKTCHGFFSWWNDNRKLYAKARFWQKGKDPISLTLSCHEEVNWVTAHFRVESQISSLCASSSSGTMDKPVNTTYVVEAIGRTLDYFVERIEESGVTLS